MSLHQENHRLIYFLESVLSSEARGREKCPMPLKSSRELIAGIKYLFDNDKVVKFFDNDKKAIFISDITIRKEKAILLINVSDRAASDITFSDPTKQKRRFARKKPGEGIEVSTHLIWDLKSTQVNTNTYLMLLEHSIGLGIGRINKYLNYLFKLIADEFPGKYNTPHPDGIIKKNGQPKYINYVCKFTLEGQVSKEFIHDLNHGTLHDIELFTERKYGVSWDSSGEVFTDRETIKLKPRNKDTARGWWKVIRRTLANNPDDYEYATISFRDAKDVTRSATIYTDSLRLANEMRYTKKDIITDFVVPLVTGYENINNEITNKMLELVE